MLAAWLGTPAIWRCCSASAFSGCVQVRTGGQAPLPRLVAQDAEFCHPCQDKEKTRNSSLKVEEGGWGAYGILIWEEDPGRGKARERWKPGLCREETNKHKEEGRKERILR